MLRAVTLADLQEFAKSLKAGVDSSHYRTLSAVKSLLAFGHRLGYLPYDAARRALAPFGPATRLKQRRPRPEPAHRILGLDDLRNRAILGC